ncbi:UL16-binding protein 6-like [Phyllostomus hastatus]|uniref:UL16-binding protein 6-like n=1 Tax=Phyllostomus hastatus TaxID=9423 RepID=UPI001E6802C5|nr:UL16-binding protein 6-like [Phyllostomus hastatus]
MASCIFCLAVFLAVLSYGSGALGDARSLCYIFNVSASGPPWCEFLGTIYETPFFKYSCKSRTAEPVGPVGMMLNATEAWNQQCEHWTELFPELQNALLDNQKHIDENFGRDSLALQGSMICEQESNGCRKTFWEFGFKGQMCLRFDSKNSRWAELHPGCSSLKDTLDDNSDISRCLGWISNGNCVKLLNQSTVLNTKVLQQLLESAPEKTVLSPSSCVTSSSVTAGGTGCTNHGHNYSPSPSPIQGRDYQGHHRLDPHTDFYLTHTWHLGWIRYRRCFSENPENVI